MPRPGGPAAGSTCLFRFRGERLRLGDPAVGPRRQTDFLADLVGGVVVELDPRKREAAMAAGALATVDPKAPDAAAQLRKALGGSVLGVLDLVGSGETATLAVESLDKGGRLVIVGLFGGAMTLAVPLVPMKALTIQGSYIGSPAELRELVALVREHGLPATPLDRRPLTAAPTALDDLRHGKVLGRVVLTP